MRDVIVMTVYNDDGSTTIERTEILTPAEVRALFKSDSCPYCVQFERHGSHSIGADGCPSGASDARDNAKAPR